MADELDVTPYEAEIVSQRLGKPFPACSRFGVIPVTRITGEPTQTALRMERRRAITEIIEAVGILSFRAMKAKLFERNGIETSFITVRTDYKALGINSRSRLSVLEPLYLPLSGASGEVPTSILTKET